MLQGMLPLPPTGSDPTGGGSAGGFSPAASALELVEAATAAPSLDADEFCELLVGTLGASARVGCLPQQTQAVPPPAPARRRRLSLASAAPLLKPPNGRRQSFAA